MHYQLNDAATESVRHHARVVLHFHPDRIGVKPVERRSQLNSQTLAGVGGFAKA